MGEMMGDGGRRSWSRYWGKAKPMAGSVPDHPLVFHSLDVAACARVYLDCTPRLAGQFSAWLGLEVDVAKQLMTFLLAVHDIGKFAENFQQKAPHVVELRFGRLDPFDSLIRHDEAGALLLEWLAENNAFPERMSEWDEDLWSVLLTASFGHHGAPPPVVPNGRGMAFARLRSAMSAQARDDARGFFDWCAQRFLPESLPPCDVEQAKLASWWIAGLAVLADWVGSNTTWFPYAEEPVRELSLDEYWEHHALPRARKAMDQAGVVVEPAKPYVDTCTLFPYLGGDSLRPAQALSAALLITDEPQVFFLEDATGSGKTEASLILAARLIDAGLADGLFFGLPTQATADQMFDRASANLPGWFDDPTRVTLVLAHGARDQSHAFLAKLAPLGDAVPGEQDTALMRVTQWLAQSNKRALQAQMGVGTLDQVLMAGLRVKHQSLRMLGLFRKVLLVDEVHSYDPYMTQVLARTLRLHAAAGGSAILLSATMPLALRSRLLNAYAEGIALWRGETSSDSGWHGSRPRISAKSCAYPLLTQWSSSRGRQPDEHAFPAAEHSHRVLDVEYVHDEELIYERIDRWLVAEQSIVWIRNTVADAHAAWKELSSRFGAERCTLFHSRFASVDRRTIQNDVLNALGKNSDASNRKGRVIVTTQVFQESLDADADQMICDACPVDVMLQRFGRYRRHLRDAIGNPLTGDISVRDGRPPGPVIVFGPDRELAPDKKWYSRFSSGAAKVYGAHGRVYSSVRAIGDRIELPAQFRTLIEAVYGDAGEPIPDALQTSEDRALGRGVAEGALAEMNVIALDEGYRGGNWSSDERIGTRLGDSIEATLVRVSGDTLEPWARGRCGLDEDEWAFSEIRVPGWWLGDAAEPPACTDAVLAERVQQLKAQRFALKYRLVLPLVADGSGGWSCILAGQTPLRLSYCEETGLGRG